MANLIVPPPPSPQKVIEQKRQESGEHNIKTSFSSGDAYEYDPNYHKMAGFLGLKKGDKLDHEVAKKIAFIRDYTGEKEELDAMVKIRDLIRTLGLPFKGKELVVRLYQYTRLAQERDKIDKEISLISETL